jgi:hypothetical protein
MGSMVKAALNESVQAVITQRCSFHSTALVTESMLKANRSRATQTVSIDIKRVSGIV